MNGIVARDATYRNGVAVAKGWRTAAATLTGKMPRIRLRGWMLDMERNARKGEPVAIEDLSYVLRMVPATRLTARQRELKAAVEEYVKNYRMSAA